MVNPAHGNDPSHRTIGSSSSSSRCRTRGTNGGRSGSWNGGRSGSRNGGRSSGRSAMVVVMDH